MKPHQLLSLSIAVAAACAMQARAAGPTLYGNIDIGVTHATGAPGGSLTELTAGSDFPDQIGFRGSEALGGGNSVIYDLATGFCGAGDFTNGTSATSLPSNGYCTGGGFMQRTSLLGLQGPWGKLVAGRFLMPVYTNAVSVDPFRNGTTASITSLNRAVSAFNYLRESQLVEYATPTVDGFSAQLVYGFGAVAGSTQSGSLGNLSLHYQHGPLYLGAAYLYNDYRTGTALESGRIPAGSTASTHVEQLFGHYDLHVVVLSAMVQTYTSGFPGSAFTPVKASTASLDNRFWMVGAAVPAGRGQFNLSYAHTDNKEVASSNASLIGVGYQYSLSRSTLLYGGLSHISNGSAAAYGVHDATNTFAGSYGQSANGLDLGLRHSF